MRLIAAFTCVAVVAAAAVAASAGAADKRPLTPHTTIGVHGAGAVKIGMTVRRAEAATGQDLVPIGDGRTGSVCWTVRVRGLPGLYFMLKGSRIARVHTGYAAGRNPTTEGIRRGDTEEAVERAYPGQIRVEPHFYNRSGHYLIYTPKRSSLRNRRIYFETDGRKVTGIRAGRLPEVRYVEGCS